MGCEKRHVGVLSYHVWPWLFNAYLGSYATAMCRTVFWVALGMSLVPLMGLGAGPASTSAPASEPASQPTTRLTFAAATTAPANAMPRQTLETIDRRELGGKYNPAHAD